MKRIISLVVAMMIVMTAFGSVTFAETAVWDGTYDISWYDANATEMHISTAEELAGLVSIQNGSEVANGIFTDSLAGKTIVLDNDIYLNSSLTWGEDGTLTTESPNLWKQIDNWCGIFDGNGKTIYNAYISYDGYKTATGGYEPMYVGLFSMVNCGTVKNLTVSNAYVHGGNNWKSTAPVVGYNSGGLIQNVHVTNSYVTGVIVSLGGIAGGNDSAMYSNPQGKPGIIDGCSVDANTIICPTGKSGAVSAGGITAFNDNYYGDLSLGKSTVSNCTSEATVIAYSEIGGIVGTNKALVDNCSYSGSVSYLSDGAGNGCTGAGGIAGLNPADGVRVGVIKNCAVTDSTVWGQSWNGVSGIAGTNYGGSITNCYSVNSTVENEWYGAGGITAANNQDNTGTITNCYTNNTAISGNGWNAGIVYVYGSATNCYYQKTDSINAATGMFGAYAGAEVTATNCDTFDANYVLATSGTSVVDALNAWVASNDGYNKWAMDEALGYIVFTEDEEVIKEYPEFVENSTALSGFDFTNETFADKYFTAFSKIYVPESYTEEVEFGIIYLSSDDAIDSDEVIVNGEKYKAEGKLDDGSYAIMLKNGEGETDHFLKAYNAFVPYLKYGTNEVYSDFIAIE